MGCKGLNLLFLVFNLVFFHVFAATTEPIHGGVERHHLRFKVAGAEINLEDNARKLSEIEQPLTEHIALVRRGGAMTNICLATFVVVSDGVLHEVALEDTDEATRIIFESSAGKSYLQGAKENLKGKSKFSSLTSISNSLNPYSFGRYSHSGMEDRHTESLLSNDPGKIEASEKEIDTAIEEIMSHFRRVWWNAGTKKWAPEFQEWTKEVSKERGKIVLLDESDLENTIVKGGLIDSLIQQIRAWNDAKWSAYETLSEVHRYIGDLKKQSDSFAKKMMGIAASLWCSEQKLMKYLYTTDKWLEDLCDKSKSLYQIDGLFLIVHSYQFPCHRCRETFVKYLELLKKRIAWYFYGEKIPFHTIVTYRQDYTAGGKPVSKAPEVEVPEISSIGRKDFMSIYKAADSGSGSAAGAGSA